MCAHSGQAKATSPSLRVFVSGQPIVMQPTPHAITACPFTTPAGNPLPCITAQWTSAATRITSMGMPVLLSDSQATCPPNGTPVTITVTQIRVMGT